MKKEEVCEDFFCANMRAVMFGDFNLDYYGNSYYCNKMKNLLNKFGIKQLIDNYTRYMNVSSTLVNYELANFDQVSALVHDVPRITDHSIISAKCTLWVKMVCTIGS
ncbi:hypothetical protein HHI36_009666 [Cryptolaemus montrouzieri]|uniref:Uncharacterized protein n=1 Tax=Cryptolaemus montrouzieri TaxID=559131 RepID=A0ABD2MGI0_9CUCU